MKLQDHPFAVEAFFDASLVLTYALPVSDLQQLLPACLQVDSFNGLGFVAVAVVKTRDLRPKGFPTWMGNHFLLIGFRIFVRYTNAAGKKLRGLYILKSATDKKRMHLLGNIFTHYNYNTTDISFQQKDQSIRITSLKSDIEIDAAIQAEATLPPQSPFADWKEARRFAGPLPFTFSFNPKNNDVLIVEGVREHWVPQPVNVVKQSIGFMQQERLKNAVLANAFIIQQIPYYWKKGIKEKWQP